MTDEITVQQWLQASGLAPIDAQALVRFVCRLDRAQQLANPDFLIASEQFSHLQKLAQRRCSGEPLAYLLGVKEFYGLDFFVTPAVLIPRPETELLVDEALSILHQQRCPTVLDLGTGSGCIAVAIARHHSSARVLAVDASAQALTVAQTNIDAHRMGERVGLLLSNWFESVAPQTFDLIVANPPYIREDDAHLLQLSFEPRSALVAAHGLDDLLHIIKNAPYFLKPNASILLEHGYDQSQDVQDAVKAAGFENIRPMLDMAGRPRLVAAQGKQSFLQGIK